MVFGVCVFSTSVVCMDCLSLLLWLGFGFDVCSLWAWCLGYLCVHRFCLLLMLGFDCLFVLCYIVYSYSCGLFICVFVCWMIDWLVFRLDGVFVVVLFGCYYLIACGV